MTSPPQLDVDVSSSGLAADIGVPTIEGRAALQQVLARMRGSVEAAEPVMIDRYEFVRRLGVGGMGIVYLARDPELDRLVALKLLHPSLVADEDAELVASRMRSEARAMARLDHPNVIRVLEVGAPGRRRAPSPASTRGCAASGTRTRSSARAGASTVSASGSRS